MTTEPRMDDWATHLPALVACLSATTGPVLECGVGIWSTPILHAFCVPIGRKLLSVEGNPEWLARFASLASPTHELRGVADWNDVGGLGGGWSLAFVDHGFAPRGPVVAALRDKARIVVMHDSECHYCGYTEALRPYDWVWTHTHSPTWTTIAGMGERPEWMEAALSPGEWGVPQCYRG